VAEGLTIAMLDEEQRRRIQAEETFRKSVRDELDPPKDRPLLQKLTEPDVLKWLVTTLIIPLTVFAWNFGAQAREEARKDVDELRGLAPLLISDKPKEKAFGMTVLKMLADSRGAAPTLGDVYRNLDTQNLSDRRSGDPQRVTPAVTVTETLAHGNPNAKTQFNAAPETGTSAKPPAKVPDTAPLPSLAFVQYYAESQRPAVDRLVAALRSDGVPIPGVENVGRTHPDTAFKYPQKNFVSVRYFRDSDREAALALGTRVERTLAGPSAPKVEVQRARTAATVPQGQVEIWFPCVSPPDRPRACV
jgi:hypothetical protein